MDSLLSSPPIDYFGELAAMMNRKTYTTDLSDREWQIIEPLLPGPKQLGRKIEYSRREILNAIFYLNRNGCAWRDLPGDFPPYGIVSHYYHAWRRRGLRSEPLGGSIATVVWPKTMSGCPRVAKR